ncbi:MAG: hypothetical protein IT306_30640 [Chloroflexi bacterium]|nr:hypothetical protein [Chloroflexota bacterium]
MKFMVMSRADKHSEAGEFPGPEVTARMMTFMQEVAEAGILVTAEGLTPSALGARVKLSNGKVTVTDGPFTETKELIASFAILNVASKEEAIRWTTKWAQVFGEMECEIRPIFEDAPPPPPTA